LEENNSRFSDTIKVRSSDGVKTYNKKLLNSFEDILGYVDKDLEYQLQVYRSK
jgi:hypothetical protein